MKKWALGLGTLLTCAALFGGAEVFARYAGFADYPLYELRDDVGYIYAPNRSGVFANRLPWRFNQYSMAGSDFTAASGGVLLIGDSIVSGSIFLQPDQKIGSLIAKRINRAVWPVGASSWGFLNEMNYLSSIGKLLPQFDSVVVISNSGDFNGLSAYVSETMQPTYRPLSLIGYFIRRKWAEFWPQKEEPNNPRLSPDTQNAWSRLLSDYRGHIWIVKHAQRQELPSGQSKFGQVVRKLQSMAPARVSIIDLAADPRWSEELYNDSIHVKPQGYRVMAEIIAEALKAQDEAGMKNAPPETGSIGGLRLGL